MGEAAVGEQRRQQLVGVVGQQLVVVKHQHPVAGRLLRDPVLGRLNHPGQLQYMDVVSSRARHVVGIVDAAGVDAHHDLVGVLPHSVEPPSQMTARVPGHQDYRKRHGRESGASSSARRRWSISI